MNITFIFFSILFFLMGFFYSRKNHFKIFLFVILVFPFTTFNTKFHVNFQIPIFLFFLIGGLLKNKYKKLVFGKLDLLILSSFLVFIVYSFLTIPLYINHEIINIIKDIKFILFGFILYLFVILNKKIVNASLTDIDFILKWNFIISTVFFILMYSFEIHLIFNEDAYFKINEIRYINYSTYFIPIYAIFILSNQIKIKKINWLYIIIPLLISGNRTIIILLIFIAGIILLRRLSVKKLTILFSTTISLFLFLFIVINNASDSSPIYRIKKLLSFEYLETAINTRLQPFYLALNSFEPHNYFFGKGLGFTYFIPWFHYRKDLDNYNIYLDSLIPTLFGKYGIFLIVPLFIFFLYLKKFSDYKSFIFYFLFLILLGLTNSFLYQNYFILILFLMFYLKSALLNIKN